MAGAKTTELFNCSVEDFFKIVSDYEKYPLFLQEVKDCKVIETKGNQKVVEFHVNVIKQFSYRLLITEQPPHKMSWTFDSGDLFKVSTGSWDLKDEAGKTRATYEVDAKFKVFIPGPISKALVNVNLPNMMSSFKKRVSEVYGG